MGAKKPTPGESAFPNPRIITILNFAPDENADRVHVPVHSGPRIAYIDTPAELEMLIESNCITSSMDLRLFRWEAGDRFVAVNGPRGKRAERVGSFVFQPVAYDRDTDHLALYPFKLIPRTPDEMGHPKAACEIFATRYFDNSNKAMWCSVVVQGTGEEEFGIADAADPWLAAWRAVVQLLTKKSETLC